MKNTAAEKLADLEREIRELNNAKVTDAFETAQCDANDMNYDIETEDGFKYLVGQSYEVACCTENEEAEKFFRNK